MRNTGRVKFVNDSEATITPDDGGESVSVHPSELDGFKSMREGQPLGYDLVEGPNGKQASNIKPL
jgi:CspA family cold shock protein